MAKTQTDRDARRAAKRAVKEAEKAGKETAKLASSLPEPAKSRVKAAAKVEQARIADVKRAASDRPYAAKRAARRSSSRLERVSVRYGTAGGRASTGSPKKGSKSGTIKQQRAQVKGSSRMAIFSGVRTLFSAITTPGDQKQARKTAKARVRRMKRA
jgi:hypothetical protein